MSSKEDYIIYGMKLLYTCICVIYIYKKIKDIKIENKNKLLLSILLISFMDFICIICQSIMLVSVFTNMIIYFGICICLYILFKNEIGDIMLSSIISFAIYYTFYAIAVVFSFGFQVIYNEKNKYIFFIIIVVIQQFLLNIFLNRKRFKNGFQFLRTKDSKKDINIILISISSVVVYLYSLATYNIEISQSSDVIYIGRSTIKYFYLNIIFFSIIVIIIIKETLKIYYRKKLLEKTITDYKSQIKEKDAKIEKLSSEIQQISDLNHRFHNRQEALKFKIDSALSNTNTEIGEEIHLSDRIKELTDEYSDELKRIRLENDLPKTGIEELDDIFTYMKHECEKNGIEFVLQVSGSISYLINNYIEENKLKTLVGDHLRDAIIAVNNSTNNYKSILAIFGIKEDYYEFCVYDSGIEFEIDTLNKLGIERATTHKDSGGTGTGFITTFKTLKETNASFVLEELNEPNDNNYTKALRFIFDNKNKFKIISYRADFLKKNLKTDRFEVICK